ncbi:MAG: repeat containing protein [Cyanobacteria bacterium RYN_339]|nr:repeat containing protein [Cyanobacteria bacterium RYN_339]
MRRLLPCCLLLAACQTAPPPVATRLAIPATGFGRLEVTALPTAARRVLHLDDLDWDTAEATLQNLATGMAPVTLTAAAEKDELTGTRAAHVTFPALATGAGYSLHLVFKRQATVLATGDRADISITGALTATTVEVAVTPEVKPVIAPPVLNLPRPYVTSLFFGPPVRFDGPEAVAVGPDGTTYVADRYNHRIRKVDAHGATSTLAGSDPGTQDGEGTEGLFMDPLALVLAPDGTLYVLDAGAHAIRKVTPTGVVTTILADLSGDGTALAIDPAKNCLYLAQMLPEGSSLERIDLAKPALENVTSKFAESPRGLLVDGADLIIADTENNCLRRLHDGKVDWLAGATDGVDGTADGAAAAARFYKPFGLALAGRVLSISDAGNHTVRQLDLASGLVTTLAGGPAGYKDGAGVAARFANPHGLAVAPDGALILADADEAQQRTRAHLRKVAADGTVTTLAGDGGVGWQDGARSPGYFDGAVELALGPAGELFVADTGHNRILQAMPDGSVSVVAGTGALGAADGIGAAATFGAPEGLCVDARDAAHPKLYVSDTYNNLIRQIDLAAPAHAVTTLAGGGLPGSSGGGYVNGTGAAARFRGPTGLALDVAHGWLFISDHNNDRIRKLDLGVPAHTVSSFVGNGIPAHMSGSGALASFILPHGLAFDAAGVLYAPDHNYNDIRRVKANGAVDDLFASDDTDAFADGPAGKLAHPMGIAVDANGRLVVGDTWNNRIRQIDLSAPASPVLSTLAGSGDAGFADGIPSQARFRDPHGVVVDAQGNVYVADTGNSCIRKLVR